MPYRKRYARKNKKTYRKTRKARPRARISRPLKPLPVAFPNKYVCKLNYSEEFNIDASSITATHVFRANDCYDCNVTGTGHQPMGFDELCALYTRFIVLGSLIKITPLDTKTSAILPAYWGVQLTDAPRLAGRPITDLLEQERNSLKRPAITRNNVADSDRFRSRIAKFSAKKFFRTAPGALRDDQYVFTQGASPPTPAYFEVYCASLLGNDPGQIHFIAQIQFIVLCYTPLVLDPS